MNNAAKVGDDSPLSDRPGDGKELVSPIQVKTPIFATANVQG